MSTIIPDEKKVSDALQWMSEHRESYSDRKKLLEDAVFHYNLNPKQEQYLYRIFLESTQDLED